MQQAGIGMGRDLLQRLRQPGAGPAHGAGVGADLRQRATALIPQSANARCGASGVIGRLEPVCHPKPGVNLILEESGQCRSVGEVSRVQGDQVPFILAEINLDLPLVQQELHSRLEAGFITQTLGNASVYVVVTDL
jgi:hypothetical protein